MSTITIDKKTMMEEIRTLISEGRTVELTAKGYSMNPFIMHLRDQIVLGPWKDEEIRKGTVVLAKTDKGYVIHRIIRREGNLITLMGDGNIGLTEQADVKEIIARVYSIKRKGRTYGTDGLTWRLYSWFWMLITPVKRYPLALWRRLNRQESLK